MGDSTLTFNDKLVKQGLVNALNGFKEGMTPQEAQAYIQKTMMKIQAAKAPKGPMQPAPGQGQAPQQAPQQEAPQQAPQQ